jgi:hypothetical protein
MARTNPDSFADDPKHLTPEQSHARRTKNKNKQKWDRRTKNKKKHGR